MTHLQFLGLTKRYGSVTAVDDLTADITPCQITAFLGANGSGKTTSMRSLLGLTQPSAGSALVDGQPYAELHHPMSTIGAVLDQGFHPRRTARNHLRVTAMQAGAPDRRVEEVIDTVGLDQVANRWVGGFSLGQRQRLALAAALVGAPSVLVMDEPFNGLDPAGIVALRHLLRSFADHGGTVLLSSHLLSEIENIADSAIIIDHGQLVREGPLDTLLPKVFATSVTSPDADRLTSALSTLSDADMRVERIAADELLVHGVAPELIGQLAAQAGVVIVGMTAQGRDLESLFTSITSVEAHS
jgi:ABC-2 type transport system ATP-binding protein